MTRTGRSRAATTIRRSAGTLLVVLGLVGLYGGFFVPWDVVLADPRIVPAPESWVAMWVMAVGILLAVWPARRGDR